MNLIVEGVFRTGEGIGAVYVTGIAAGIVGVVGNIGVAGAFIASGIAIVAAALLRQVRVSSDRGPFYIPVPRAVGAKGVIRVARLRDQGVPFRHCSILVNGPQYSGMEDNDLRGFLDGRYCCGWNQPGQIHVRLGRVGWEGRTPKYGEYELFRVLQRWSELRLPRGARVTDARIELVVEKGTPEPLQIVLYAVRKDWNPGSGGVHGNNVSVPKPGEVWWNDAAYGERAWGLPGAGLASRDHPDADTDIMPLADTIYKPGDREISLSGPPLTEYIDRCVTSDRPLLFLLKLSDIQEDVPGTLLSICSGNHGDSRNVVRRPRLVLDWEVESAEVLLEEPVQLEHGRSYLLPRTPVCPGQTYLIAYDTHAGHPKPIVEMREGGAGWVTEWSHVPLAVEPTGEWFQLRVTAAIDPVTLGESFTAVLKDTWILTAPPEEQPVIWTFVSPSGAHHTITAEYQGAFTWRVCFQPNELGLWRYSWTQQFIAEPYDSAIGEFDVVARDRASIKDHLMKLEEEIEVAGQAPEPEDVHRWRVRFSRLERAAVHLDEGEGFDSAPVVAMRAALDRVRTRLGGEPLPDPFPLKSNPLRSRVGGVSLREPIPLDRSVPFRSHKSRGWWPFRRVDGRERVPGIVPRKRDLTPR